jgi:O-antigen/teichoic acid export membrane protein
MAIASKFLGSIFGAIKKTKVTFISTLAGAIVNLVVIFSLLDVIVVMAANIAFLAGFTTAVLVRTIVLRKQIGLKVNYWYFTIFVPLLAVIIVVFNNLGWYYNLLAFLAVGILGVYILKNELLEIYRKVKAKMKK